MNVKRISIFCGHYGSGKTNVAVNYAFMLRSMGLPTVIADLDIVNPYFRTKDSENELSDAGIELISLPFANTNVDLPAIPSKAYSLVQDKSKHAVLDIGGDDRGAYALGRFADIIKDENDFDCFFVANFFRPLTSDAKSAFEVMKEIEASSKIPFTGIINNSNLGEDTTSSDIENSFEKALELSRLSGLPVSFTSVKNDLAEEINAERVLKLELQKKYW